MLFLRNKILENPSDPFRLPECGRLAAVQPRKSTGPRPPTHRRRPIGTRPGLQMVEGRPVLCLQRLSRLGPAVALQKGVNWIRAQKPGVFLSSQLLFG